MQQPATVTKQKQKIRCPQCSNYVDITTFEDGGYGGNCKVCKVTFYCKKKSPKERVIHIIAH